MTDTELIDFLQKLNDEKEYTGYCVLRMSDQGRGWRMHESSRNGYRSVREAIRKFAEQRDEPTR